MCASSVPEQQDCNVRRDCRADHFSALPHFLPPSATALSWPLASCLLLLLQLRLPPLTLMG